MPAYSVPLRTSCEKRECIKRATRKVFDTWNGERGIYCTRHAEEWVKEWNEEYKKDPHDGTWHTLKEER